MKPNEALGAPLSARKARSRKTIVNATRVVLTRHGLAQTTVEMILLEAGLSRSTFYTYFTDKSDATYAVIDELQTEEIDLLAKFSKYRELTAPVLRKWFYSFYKWWGEHHREISILVRDASSEVAARSTRRGDQYANVLVGDGCLWQCKHQDAVFRAHLLIYALDGAMYQIHSGSWRISIEKLVKQLVILWMHAITTP
jgi:AcrR family transcriptional regulator